MLMRNLRQAFRSFIKTPGLHLRRAGDPGRRHRRHHGDFQRRQRHPAETYPLSQTPNRLVMVYSSFLKENLDRSDASYQDIRDWGQQNNVFDKMAPVAILAQA